MASVPDYIFTRDYLDRNRLNLQHYLWVELFRYHIHPNIPTNDAKLKVADVGTGTGIWLIDLAARLPETVQLDGFDITLDAAPMAEWLPPNVTLNTWDIRDHVPENLVESYDIVHIRLFSMVLRDDELPHIIRNLVKLVKPGGYLQWADVDLNSIRIEKSKPQNKIDSLIEMAEVLDNLDPRIKSAWVPKLAGLFKLGGLEDVDSDIRDAPPHSGLALHECSLVAHESYAHTVGNERAAKIIKGLMPHVMEEMRCGAYYAVTQYVIIGRKPKITTVVSAT